MSGFELRDATRADGEELNALFNRVFRTPADSRPPRSPAAWDWRYRGDPIASHSSVAVDRESGRIVAHVGGLCMPTWCRGRVRPTALSVDNMVDPEWRRGLKRMGLFARLVNHWVDSWFGCDRDFLAWGFPTHDNFRIGQRFSKYSLVRPLNVLVAEDLGAVRESHPGVRVRLSSRLDPELDALWERSRAGMEMGVVRDHAYLQWRYAEHPETHYELLEARDARSGALRGLAVLRDGGLAEDALMLVDWLVPLEDEAAAAGLRSAVAERAIEADAGVLLTWFPEGVPWFERFQRKGFHVRFTPLIHVARSWDRSVRISELRRDFYATLGDIDSY